MAYKIYSELISKENIDFIHIFNIDNDIFNIDIIITLPENTKLEIANKLLLLTTLKVVEPFVRCDLSFEIIGKNDNKNILKNLSQNDNIDDEIFLYANLNWTKINLSYNMVENIESKYDVSGFYINQNTIRIFDEELSSKYKNEVSKTLPFAIYERLRAECDYAWKCSECPKGLNGECEAIIYEQYIKTQN